MLTNIFKLLAKLREGISKPEARITVEEYTITEPGDALRFQFRWYEDQLLTMSIIISSFETDRIRGEEEILIERLIADVNREILKKEKEKTHE